jgi:hypothetical protein
VWNGACARGTSGGEGEGTRSLRGVTIRSCKYNGDGEMCVRLRERKRKEETGPRNRRTRDGAVARFGSSAGSRIRAKPSRVNGHVLRLSALVAYSWRTTGKAIAWRRRGGKGREAGVRACSIGLVGRRWDEVGHGGNGMMRSQRARCPYSSALQEEGMEVWKVFDRVTSLGTRNILPLFVIYFMTCHCCQ